MKYLSTILLFIFLIGCTTTVQEKENPLEGTTWERTSGKWSREDTTFTFPNSPYDQCILIYGKTHFANVIQDTSRKVLSSVLATYSVDGDNLTYTFEMCRSYEDIGKSINMKFQIEGDQLILKAKGYRYFGYDWKEAHLVYKKID
jgi:hypothetical protein